MSQHLVLIYLGFRHFISLQLHQSPIASSILQAIKHQLFPNQYRVHERVFQGMILLIEASTQFVFIIQANLVFFVSLYQYLKANCPFEQILQLQFDGCFIRPSQRQFYLLYPHQSSNQPFKVMLPHFNPAIQGILMRLHLQDLVNLPFHSQLLVWLLSAYFGLCRQFGHLCLLTMRKTIQPTDPPLGLTVRLQFLNLFRLVS